MSGRVTALMEDYRRERASLGFLDCNLWLGPPRSPEFARLPSGSPGFGVPDLLQRMERYHITGGIVSHFAALTYGAAWANDLLLQSVEGTSLWAGITLVPELFQDETEGRAYLNTAICRKARLVRLFPHSHNFTWRSWCTGALLGALSASELPLALWHSEVSWEDVRGLSETYPRLTLIIEGTPTKILYFNRLFYPLLAQHPNLRLEMHSLVSYLAVEDLVQNFGARRLIFGSYMPVYDPNATIMQITHARISPQDKALMARENLRELIEGVHPS
jgi:hypothetical protein